MDTSARGPTCVWEEGGSAANPHGDPRAGAPRDVRALHVVPAVAGRLLRFDGASLHSVHGPKVDHLLGEGGGSTSATTVRRAVVLFNTWQEPPGLPSPLDPAAPKAVDALKSMSATPTCCPASEWVDMASARSGATADASGTPMTQITVPLLGDYPRRGCQAASLTARVAQDALRDALHSEDAVHVVELEPCEADEDDAQLASTSAPPATPVVGTILVDDEEELAMRLGHAAHLEAEFWGVDDEDDDDDDDDGEEEEEEEGQMGAPGDFWAQVAALQSMESAADNEADAA